jgi:hypothetical protein
MGQLAYELNNKKIEPRRGDRWYPTVIKYILDNQLYTGCYKVAGITDQIDELRIINNNLFQKAKSVRHRNKRVDIPPSRKQAIIDDLIEKYKLYLDDIDEFENSNGIQSFE